MQFHSYKHFQTSVGSSSCCSLKRKWSEINPKTDETAKVMKPKGVTTRNTFLETMRKKQNYLQVLSLMTMILFTGHTSGSVQAMNVRPAHSVASGINGRNFVT